MTFIYKIYDIDTNECYVGSTNRQLKLRMKDHRSVSNNTSSKKIIANNNYDIIILEVCEEKDRQIREQYYIDITPNTLNKANASHDVENRRIWRENHKPKKQAQDKQRREWVKSFGMKLYEYRDNNLLRIDPNIFN